MTGIILIHGAVLNGGMWSPVAADLRADFTVLTPDLPGHGTRAGEPFSLRRAVEVVHEAAGSLGGVPVVLAGDSLGGYVAIAAAAGLAGRLAGALLSGCTADFQGPMGLAFVAQVALTRILPAAPLEAKLRRRIAAEFEAGPAILAGAIRTAAFAEAVAELRRFDARAALAAIQAPVVLVNGARDWQQRLGERGVLRAAPRARLERLPGVGHGVSLHRPAIFAGLVRHLARAGVAPA